MINRLKLFINNEKSLFNENKIKYIFSTIILISIGLLSFMLPSFSSGPLHKIPLLFTGILCLMIFIYIFSFDNFTISKYAIFMIMFLLAIFISSLLNDITQIQKTEFLLIIMFIMLHMFVSKNDFVDKAIFALYIGLCFFLLYFFISYFKQIISLDFNRLGGAFGNVNAIGEYFIIGYLINMYLAIIRKKYLLLLTVPFFIVFGLFTGSKSFFMSLVILSICFMIMLFGKKKWYISIIIIVVGLLCAIGLLQMPAFAILKKRLLDMIRELIGQSSLLDLSTIERQDMFFEGIYLFTIKPLFGWGISGFNLNSAYNAYSHSTISELLCDFGIVGFVTFLLPIFISFIDTKKNDDRKWILKYLLLIYVSILAIFGVLLGDKLYYVVMSIVCSISKSNKNKMNGGLA